MQASVTLFLQYMAYFTGIILIFILSTDRFLLVTQISHGSIKIQRFYLLPTLKWIEIVIQFNEHELYYPTDTICLHFRIEYMKLNILLKVFFKFEIIHYLFYENHIIVLDITMVHKPLIFCDPILRRYYFDFE